MNTNELNEKEISTTNGGMILLPLLAEGSPLTFLESLLA